MVGAVIDQSVILAVYVILSSFLITNIYLVMLILCRFVALMV